MYCKYCNVRVEGDRNVCPLCKNKLSGEPDSVPRFPDRKIYKLRTPATFSNVYFFAMICIVAVCAAVNIAVSRKHAWSAMVLASLIYIYMLIKHSILYKGTGGSKIFVQTVSLWLLGVAAQYIFFTVEWIWSVGLPLIVLCSFAFHIIFISIFNAKSRDYVRYMIYTSFLGFLPEILYAAGVFKYHTLSAACFVVSLLILTGLMIFSRNTVFAEFRKKGHL